MPNTADIAAQAGVRVRDLEWVHPTPGATLTRANTDFGVYRVWTYAEANGRWFWSLDGYVKISGEGDSEKEMQAAAQADCASRILAAIEPQAVAETFQQRVQPWMIACFGEEISADRVERGDRLLEEVFELLQSGGYDPARVLPLRDYVWSRDVGEPSQEVGGVEVTLAAYCLAHGLDMHAAGETELARIWTKVEQIRAKQAAKPKHSPLPAARAALQGEPS